MSNLSQATPEELMGRARYGPDHDIALLELVRRAAALEAAEKERDEVRQEWAGAAKAALARIEAAEARVAELETALRRLGSMEAFNVAQDLEFLTRNHGMCQGVVDELSMRIDYARAALAVSSDTSKEKPDA